MPEKRLEIGVSCEPESVERTVVTSSCVPHENDVTSFRGTRVGSWPRHQASTWSASDCMVFATAPRLSVPSDGIRYTQWTGLPATALGTRSAWAAAPHHAVAAAGRALAPRASISAVSELRANRAAAGLSAPAAAPAAVATRSAASATAASTRLTASSPRREHDPATRSPSRGRRASAGRRSIPRAA